MTIKLCDFGLARNLYGGSTYQVSDTTLDLPLKWMAIESFDQYLFTTKSDVWSFGVTCWEIFSFGSEPYIEIRNDHFRQWIFHGNRLRMPEQCPREIFSIIQDCWDSDPHYRPSFGALLEIFEKFIDQYEAMSMEGTSGYLSAMRTNEEDDSSLD